MRSSRPSPHPRDDDVTWQLAKLLDAASRREARELIEGCPQLLSAEINELLTAAVAVKDEEGEGEGDQRFAFVQSLLRSCRENGVEAATSSRLWLPDEAGIQLEQATEASSRFEKTGDVAACDAALAALEEAQAILDQAEPILLQRTALLHADRYEATGHVGDLERAVTTLVQAIAIAVTEEQYAVLMANLGRAKLDLFIATGDDAALNDSINHLAKAVDVLEETSPDAPRLLCHLGDAYRARYDTGGWVADIERAVEIYDWATELAAEGSPTTGRAYRSLGVSLRRRFEILKEPADLKASIAALEMAVADADAEETELAERRVALAASLMCRWAEDGNTADLDAGVRYGQEALDRVAPEAWEPHWLHNQGRALLSRFRKRGNAADLDLAIVLVEEAIQLTPDKSPQLPAWLNSLGQAYQERHAQGGGAADLRHATDAYRAACERSLRHRPEVALGSARAWGSWALERGEWSEAATALAMGVDAAGRLFESQQTREHRLAWLSTASGLATNAAYAQARSGQPTSAVATLEQGRARVLGEFLEHRLLLSGDDDESDAMRGYRAAVARLDELRRRGARVAVPAGHAEDLSRARRAVAKARATVNALSRGTETPPEVGALVAPTEPAPIVYLIAAGQAGMALTLRSGGDVQTLELPALASSAFVARLRGFLNSGEERARDYGTWRSELSSLTRWLWDAAMGPVLESLGGVPSLVLVPTGSLGLLPLHAAWVEDSSRPTGRRYVIDEAAVSYAASARARLAALTAAARVGPADGALGIAEPTPVKLLPLPHAQYEVDRVLAHFPRSETIAGPAATRAAVLAALDEYPVAHLACHGLVDLREPMRSALAMAEDGWLSLRNILEHRLDSTRLVVLSACETGAYGGPALDETVGLPTGLIGAGAAGVIGSLFSVPDVATTMLMVRFYELWQDQGLEPAAALAAAQRWVRDTTNGEKQARFAGLAALAPRLTQAQTEFWETARGHADPANWAGFVHVGA